MDIGDKLAAFVRRCGDSIYTEDETSLSWHTGIARQAFDRVKTKIPPDSLRTVLDLGCANGFARTMFSEAGVAYYRGVTARIDDVPADAHANVGMSCSFTACDMHEIAMWPKPQRGYDLIWARHILEHSPIPLFVLVSLREQLAPGGYLYVEVPAPDTKSMHPFNENHYSCFGVEGWVGLIRKAGLNFIDIFNITVEVMSGPDTYHCFLLQSVSRQAEEAEPAA